MTNKRQKIKNGEIRKDEITKTSKLERLSKKVLIAFEQKDEEGKIYVNYCSYFHHPGIIGDYKFQEGCESNEVKEKYYCKNCKHYRKLIEQ